MIQEEIKICVSFGRQNAAKQHAGVDSGELSHVEQEVCRILMDNPQISIRAISDSTGKSKSAVSRIIGKPVQAGAVERKGNQRNGFWIVL